MIGVAEQSADKTVRTRFAAWLEELYRPPHLHLVDDADQVEAAVWQAYLQRWAELTARHASGQTAVADVDDAPPGWDNATLLAQMRAAHAAG